MDGLKEFLRGYWEFPTERPQIWLSFARGAILSLAVSLLFYDNSTQEMLFWAAIVGIIWLMIDQMAWRYFQKKIK